MTLPEFRYHSPDERPQLVLSHGLLLTIQTRGTYCVFLYHMGDFFAEVWYFANRKQGGRRARV